eukprot:828084-Rhodomonas_salina.1
MLCFGGFQGFPNHLTMSPSFQGENVRARLFGVKGAARRCLTEFGCGAERQARGSEFRLVVLCACRGLLEVNRGTFMTRKRIADGTTTSRSITITGENLKPDQHRCGDKKCVYDTSLPRNWQAWTG